MREKFASIISATVTYTVITDFECCDLGAKVHMRLCDRYLSHLSHNVSPMLSGHPTQTFGLI